MDDSTNQRWEAASQEGDDPPTTVRSAEGRSSAQGALPIQAPDRMSPTVRETRRWYVLGCFLLMLAAIQVSLGPKIQLSQWILSSEGMGGNAGVAEGVSWLNGRLDLPHEGGPDPQSRKHDTAYFPKTDQVFNVFPPLIPILTVLLRPLHAWLGYPQEFWAPFTYTWLVFWPLPIVGFLVFRRQTGDPIWAAVLTLGWMGGTAVLPNLHGAVGGLLGPVDHVVSQVGLLILAADILGRRRIWPALIGLLIATYTRQMTCLYALPLIWVAARKGRRELVTCFVGLAIIATPLLALNYSKFGNPLGFGYRYIYAGREDGDMGKRCLETGTFSLEFIPENAYYMHVAPPAVYVSPTQIRFCETNNYGTSIWITTPLLVFVILSAPSWWRDGSRRILMLGTLPVLLGLLCYHSPGFIEHGYSRFALDFLPVWLLVIAPETRGRLRTWFTLGCIAWSLLYFQAIVPNRAVVENPAMRQPTSANH